MHVRSMARPFQLILLAAALVLAGAVGVTLASGAATTSPLTGVPGAAVPAAPNATDVAKGTDGGTVDAIIAAALSEPALNAGSVDAAPSTRPLAGVARGAGLLRTLIGRTDRAEIAVTTATGEQTILYVRGKIAAVSATSIVIKLRDGTSQSYAMDATTRIRAQGKVIGASDLSTGEMALVLGLKSGDTYTAKFVRALPRAGATGS